MNMNHHGHASSAHEEEMDLNRSIMKLTLKDNTSSETTTLKEEESSLAETVSVSSTSYCSSCHGHDINSSVHSCHSCQCSISSYITPVVHEEEDDDDDDDETHHGIHHNHRDIPHRDILPNDIPHNDILDHPLCPVTGRHTSVLSHYVLFPKLLGEGNYGTVRECIHRSSWRTYAIKTIDKSKILRLDHLQNEIRLLKSIDHEGILNMVDYYEDADYVHIITEKYSGGDLFDRIVERTDPAAGCYSEDGAAGMMARLLEAVAYLHERNIVHRDIKPENILFASSANDDRPTLIDFGLSRRHDSMREPLMTNPVGTSYYMSPELLAGSYDRSCDLWAVGIIAYILLCGYPPFNGPTDNDVYEAIGVGNLEFREKHWNNKSRDAMDFVLALLKRDPKERMTAEEALAILGSYGDADVVAVVLVVLQPQHGVGIMEGITERGGQPSVYQEKKKIKTEGEEERRVDKHEAFEDGTGSEEEANDQRIKSGAGSKEAGAEEWVEVFENTVICA
eukprot:CAMPEP_0183711232 /NCGR_PEP_ID=MMETSP0737-20130205/6792_1 /TAXON_ID=385413 /ORGANISM="Thalassiosira miniscula, Strain CCMP1093" /LENGTH=506 /DNA_ID=CAMNT_0025939701 /DNA_START=254 /DNA_END=1776 /DNA_ORIENTATION=+